MKLNEEEKKIFEDFLSFLQLHPELKKWELSSEPVLSLPDLEIDPSQRLVRCNQKEVGLTAKEYSLLCLLTVNNGRVLTYSQIYEKVWGEALTINERGTIGYHVRNLRKKHWHGNGRRESAPRLSVGPRRRIWKMRQKPSL